MTGKRVIEVTFAVLPMPLFLFIRMAIMGPADLGGRDSGNQEVSRMSVCDLPKTLPSPLLDSMSPSVAGN